MSQPHDDYKRLESAISTPCPVCGADAELWQYSTAADAPTSKVVMCTNGERFDPQDGIKNEGCLLYMPPDGFYKATAREAIRYWNEYAKALMEQQRTRRWARAKVLRKAATQGAQPIETTSGAIGQP